jgi:N-acetylglucosamine malate deacetylase 1
MKLDILAVGAHPDDIELCCSGTLAQAVRHGQHVGIIDLTEGELGTRGSREIRTKEAAAASKILGGVRENLRLPDGNIEVHQKNILKLVSVYRKYRPECLLIPHFEERHPDHVHAHYLAKEAWFYSGLRKIKTKVHGKEQEPWRPAAMFHYMQWYEFVPSFVVDITDVYETRLASIKAHRSQFHDPNSKDPQTILSQQTFLDFLEARTRNYGMKIGVTFGEPFYSVEPVGVKNLLDLKLFRG